MDVRRGLAGAVVERPEVARIARTGIRTGDSGRPMVEPLAGALQVGARHARIPGAAADVGAAAVKGVELRLEQFVAVLERFCECRRRLAAGDESPKLFLRQVLRRLVVNDIDLAERCRRVDNRHQHASSERHHEQRDT